MRTYFDYHYDGPPFELYGAGHVTFLVIFGIALWFLIWGWKNPSEKARERGRRLVLGSNYMYSMRKPETASALDLMGPWPWYLPFAWQDRQKVLAAR